MSSSLCIIFFSWNAEQAWLASCKIFKEKIYKYIYTFFIHFVTKSLHIISFFTEFLLALQNLKCGRIEDLDILDKSGIKRKHAWRPQVSPYLSTVPSFVHWDFLFGCYMCKAVNCTLLSLPRIYCIKNYIQYTTYF